MRDQGDFGRAVDAYHELLVEAPNDSIALAVSREVIDIYQNRTLEPEKAQGARLALVDKFTPGFSWSGANPALSKQAREAREAALRESAQYELAKAEGVGSASATTRGRRGRATDSGTVFTPAQGPSVRSQSPALRRGGAASTRSTWPDYGASDSARAVDNFYAEALFGDGQYARAGAEYARTAYAFTGDTNQAVVATEQHVGAERDRRVRLGAEPEQVRSGVAGLPVLGHQPYADTLSAHRCREAGADRGGAARVGSRTVGCHGIGVPPVRGAVSGGRVHADGDEARRRRAVQVRASTATPKCSGIRRMRAPFVLAARAWPTPSSASQAAAAATYADSLVKAGQYQRAAQDVYVAYADANPTSEKAADALRDAIETYMLADSVARARGDEGASRDARSHAAELSKRLITQYPLYRYRLQYQTLYADLLAETGKGDESIDALRKMIEDNPEWHGRADAEIRLAVAPRLIAPREGSAPSRMSSSPWTIRTTSAQPTPCTTRRRRISRRRDTLTAARAYGDFARRYPTDSRAGPARALRVTLLKAAGDTTAVNVELANLCTATPPAYLRADCAARAGRAAFAQGVQEFERYRPMRFVIAKTSQLTALGVKRASAPKLELLNALTKTFTRAIETGDPEYLSAATYYIGVAQWEYGNFLKNVQLPASLTDAERTAAAQGAAGQAGSYYGQANKTWQALVDKAAQQKISNKWIDMTRDGLQGKVPDDL